MGRGTPNAPYLFLSHTTMRIDGSSSCNNFGGTYTVNGPRLQVSSVFSTTRACVDQWLNDQDGRFRTMLSDTREFRIRHDTLELRDSVANKLGTFVATAR